MSVSDTQLAESVSGGASYRRHFDKEQYPLLGEEKVEPIFSTR